jgi:serine/threonine-protein kinase HipA
LVNYLLPSSPTDSADEPDGFAENEHFCLALARRTGLAAAHTEWQSIGGIPTLIVERYDRAQVAGHWQRIHQEDCCQALGVHPDSKYESDGGPGFPVLMNLLNGTDAPQTDRDRLMRAACFTYLIGATDVHGKNFSLLHGRGDNRPGMRLAPLYDIASAWPYTSRLAIQKMKLAMRVGGHYRIREILPRHFHKLALACHYSTETLMAALQSLAEQLPDEAAALMAETTVKGMARPVLSKLVEGLAKQCKAVIQSLEAAS